MEEIELGQKTAAGKQRFSPQGRRLGTRFGKVLVWLACYVVVLQSGYFMLKKILALTNCVMNPSSETHIF